MSATTGLRLPGGRIIRDGQAVIIDGRAYVAVYDGSADVLDLSIIAPAVLRSLNPDAYDEASRNPVSSGV